MSRKSTHTDKKLFDQGRKLLIKKGASQLSVREVCDKAGVNLGMFNYHFGSKDKFIEKILLDIYESFLADFELVESDTKLDTLELQLTLMARFARDNRHLILVLLNDVLNGEKAVQKFAKSKMRKHFMILAKTLKSCQKSGEIIDAPIPLLLTQIAGSIGLSNLIPEVLSHLGINKVFDLGLKAVTNKLITDEAIELRVKIVIQGIKKVDK
ncbi:TetR/AcrR family transcriptional regulator [Halobacteriovorax sp. HLS]|uniref:TetR/AcrR family transcriptional regulator n=1 Tax=Halobacteriovorax sp. HLS TaxID=2234000 RepID=UPI000FDB84AE|nr:TetR/AcrR family transcriptional regulator [Halobacteriovorax sp. HLS]